MSDVSLYRVLATRLLEGEFNYAFSISLKHKYLYVENAKSACTTLKSVLGEWEFAKYNLGRDIPRAFQANVHANVIGTPFVKPFQLGEELFETIARSNQYLRFSFVRNPFTRLLSAYLDKVVGRTPEASQIFDEAKSLGLITEPDEMTFLTFLRAIESTTAQGRPVDKHWRLQSFQLWPEELSYGFIGKVENLRADIDYLAARFGFASPSLDRFHGHETRASKRIGEYYDDESADLVRKLYEEDFKNFNYNKALPGAE